MQTTPKKMAVIQVALPTPLRTHFDYLPPITNTPDLQPGMRVNVPFGRRQLVGVILATQQTSILPRHKLKTITKAIDAQPLWSTTELKLLHWVARYYHHPVGEVFAHALPALLRQGKPAQPNHALHWQLTASGKSADCNELKRAPRQQAVLAYFQQYPHTHSVETLAQQLSQDMGNWRGAIKSLINKGLLEAVQVSHLQPNPNPHTLHVLNEAQAHTAETITHALGQHQTFLLEGITGSGKTEVYMQCIQDVLARDKQTLVLVPEIGLTPQLVQRFRQHLPCPVAVMHSGMSDSERLNAWLAARTGEARVLIGTRSAVFTPLQNLGLIIIDEEHDLSLKQQDGLRYSARDIAIMRARETALPIVLGSATPSLESLYNVQQQRYAHLQLSQRAGGARLPTLMLQDVRSQKLQNGLSVQLIQAIQQHLAQNRQVLLFLNRRGFAPVLMCYECGWLSHCPRCDAFLTLHQRAHRLRCHHCGTEQALPDICPTCAHTELHPMGMGTERVEQALEELFPDYPVLRIDRDSTRKKGSLQQLLQQAQQGQGQILLGTQMLAKGHHFPNVTLVGILNCDQGLYSADFRASERMGQLILQVAGRAGRAEQAGEVIIQTCHPHNPLLTALQKHDYQQYGQQLLAEREHAQLPPFSYHVLIRAEATDEQAPAQFLQTIKQAAPATASNVELLGPFPAPMTKRAGRYRYQLLCQASSRGLLQQLLRAWIPKIETLPNRKKVRWSVDIDPQEMY